MLDLVDKGFRERKSEEVDDAAILNRIMDAYHKAKETQKNAPSVYQVSNEWV